MIKWAPFPFVRYVLVLIVGLSFYIWTGFYHAYLPWIFAGLVIVYFLIERFTPNNYRNQLSSLMAVIGLSSLLIAGIIIAHQRTDSLASSHLLHQQDSIHHYQAVIVSAIQDKPKSYRAEAELRAIDQFGYWKPAQGKILLSFDKSSSSLQGNKPVYGQLLLIKGQPSLVKPPANPEEFDYRQYLFYQHITHQHYLRPSDFVVIGHTTPNLVMPFAIRVASYAENVLTQAIGAKREYAVANALILGIRDDLDADILSAYSASGAMHILSVSGLHVGILFIILNFILKHIKKLPNGRFLFAVVMLVLLWFYAFVTALSPSVLRSVTMFSFVVIAEAIQRKNKIFNTLSISAFLLLCWDPYLLMSVGFQLSYLAVVGIVLLTPGLLRLWKIPDPYASYRTWRFWKKLKRRQDYNRFLTSLSHKSVDWLWNATCVSITAQLITFPLGLYYFHQFPTYFLLANPVVLLLSALVLPMGLALVAISWIHPVISAFGILLKWVLWLLNTSVVLTEKLPYALLAGIDFSITETIVVYLLIFSFLGLFVFRNFRYLPFSFMLVLILAGLNGRRVWEQQQQQAVVIHSIRQHSVMSLIEGDHAWLLCDSAFIGNRSLFNFHLANYWCKKGISKTEQVIWGSSSVQGGDSSQHFGSIASHHYGAFSLMVWHGKSFLCIHTAMGNQKVQLPSQAIDYLIIRQGAVKDLAGLVNDLSVKQLVLDTSNKPYLAASLSNQAKVLGIPCHNLAKQGALLVDF
ncbi:MAG: ComEC/Rec2 family competence protein [Bacteroidota bacterium]